MTFVVGITGASSGVGRAAAQAFAREGATVGLIARGPEALAATAKEVESLGGQPVVLEWDVADPQALEAAASELERHGEIEVWVNNAMASVFAPVWEMRDGIAAAAAHMTERAAYVADVLGAHAPVTVHAPHAPVVTLDFLLAAATVIGALLVAGCGLAKPPRWRALEQIQRPAAWSHCGACTQDA